MVQSMMVHECLTPNWAWILKYAYPKFTRIVLARCHLDLLSEHGKGSVPRGEYAYWYGACGQKEPATVLGAIREDQRAAGPVPG